MFRQLTYVLFVLAVLFPSAGHAQESFFASRDSLELASHSLALKLADLEFSKTDLLHRLIPRVTLSASFGMHDILFSEIPVALVIPRDAYRLTISFSLDEIMNTSRHEAAVLEKEKEEIKSLGLSLKQKSDQRRRELKAKALREEVALVAEEVKLLQKIADYHGMLYDQGGIKFDTLTRSRLQVIAAKQRMGRLLLEIGELTVN